MQVFVWGREFESRQAFLFFFSPPFDFFSLGAFCSDIVRIYVPLWKCTTLHNSCLPCAEGQVWVWYSIMQVWARVPCFTRARAVYTAWCFFQKSIRSPLGPNTYLVRACVQLWICGRGLEPRQALQAHLVAFHFRLPFFFKCFLRSVSCVFWSICPWIVFARKLNTPAVRLLRGRAGHSIILFDLFRIFFVKNCLFAAAMLFPV